jgi:RNA polymerase sigma-70 factor (ECF subfamily)
VAQPVEQDVLVLFDHLAPGLLRYALSMGLTGHQAEDVVQDAFLALFRHLRLGRPRDNLRAWLFQVTRNLALKERRRSQRGAVALDIAAAQRQSDPAPNPEAVLAADQRRRLLMSVVRALPLRDRQCLAMRASGLKYREIAAALGVSLGAVAKSLARAGARLVNAEAVKEQGV